MAGEDRGGTRPAGRALLAEGAGYTLVEVGQQALALVVLPVFFFFLTVADFGVITMSIVLTHVGSALGTLGLDFSVMRLYFRWTDDERARVVAGVTLVSGLWSLTLAAVCHVVLSSVALTPGYYWPLTLGWWAGLILSIRGVPLALVRVQGAVKKYATFVLGGAVLQVVIQSACVITGAGAWGYMFGYTLGAAASAALAFYAVRREYRWTPGVWRLPPEIVAYTARVLPSVLFSRFIAVADRLVLSRWVSTEALGVYGAASRFTTPVKFLSGGFKMALAPVLSREERNEGFDETFGQLGRFVVLGMLLVGSVVAAGVWFTQYTPWAAASADLQRLVGLLLVAQFLSGLSYLGQVRLYYSPWPWTASLVVGANAVVLVAGLVWLVPRDGSMGAALAELLAAGAAVVVLIAIALITTRRIAPWATVAAPLLTFAPCLAASWLAGGPEQLMVFVVTCAGYATALLFYFRRHAPTVTRSLWER
jgi:O-antigen/teichoic acid export membrane protein